jgi:hypothetical protein
MPVTDVFKRFISDSSDVIKGKPIAKIKFRNLSYIDPASEGLVYAYRLKIDQTIFPLYNIQKSTNDSNCGCDASGSQKNNLAINVGDPLPGLYYMTEAPVIIFTASYVILRGYRHLPPKVCEKIIIEPVRLDNCNGNVDPPFEDITQSIILEAGFLVSYDLKPLNNRDNYVIIGDVVYKFARAMINKSGSNWCAGFEANENTCNDDNDDD